MKFQVGDRVKTSYGLGTIIEIGNDSIPYLVEHDQPIPGGHDGQWYSKVRGKPGHCWWFNEGFELWGALKYEFSPVPENKWDILTTPTSSWTTATNTYEITSLTNQIIASQNYLRPEEEHKPMSLIKALKAKLSKTDRTLIKHGYLDHNGERTSKYESELWDTVRTRLIDAEDTPEFRKELAQSLSEE